MKPMKHKGYAARIEYSDEDDCFIGHIAGIRDVIAFQGESVQELRSAFHEAVDGYLDFCEKQGREPQKAYSGKLLLRIPPDIHAAAAIAAETSGKSINQLVTEILGKNIPPVS